MNFDGVLFSCFYLPTEKEVLSRGLKTSPLLSLSVQFIGYQKVSTFLQGMDLCRNISVSGGVPVEFEPEQQLFSPSGSNLGSLDDLFSGNNTEGDMNLEWLSIFVEDCLSSSGNCIPPPAPAPAPAPILPQNVEKNTTEAASAANSKPLQLVKPQKNPKSSSNILLHKFVIPGKARSKRNRNPIGSKARRSHNTQLTSWSHNLQMTTSSDPPLLQQAYWLADSELILPKKEEIKQEDMVLEKEDKEEDSLGSLEGSNEGQGQLQQQQQQPRRCTHCLAQRTPQWRAGPLGPKTLCNACGVRYKSGRLLPEYRPAKSPTFVSYKHSNSHKKVLEMRTMSLLSSDSSYSS